MFWKRAFAILEQFFIWWMPLLSAIEQCQNTENCLLCYLQYVKSLLVTGHWCPGGIKPVAAVKMLQQSLWKPLWWKPQMTTTVLFIYRTVDCIVSTGILLRAETADTWLIEATCVLEITNIVDYVSFREYFRCCFVCHFTACWKWTRLSSAYFISGHDSTTCLFTWADGR